jgi:two-component system CheB/CheR fusion protein
MDITAPRLRHRPLRILLVDGHADTLALTHRTLRRADYEVIPALTFDDGLRLGLTHAPDVLVSDIRLPDGSGWQLFTQLRERHPGLVGIAACGVGTAADVARSERAGFCLHLTKPVDYRALVDVIERCVAAAAHPA